MELFELFNGKFNLSIGGVAFLVFSIFAIASVGYLLGKITVKGISLGTAGVFLTALLFGCFFYTFLSNQLAISGVNYTTEALKTVENLGLLLFVNSVGFTAGPKFFNNFKKGFKTYILLGLIVVASSALVCIVCKIIAKNTIDIPDKELNAIMAGVYSGALSSTPSFSAAKEAVGKDYASFVAVGNGMTYIFGVIGVVLFVQLVPKFIKADMSAERAKFGNDNFEGQAKRLSDKKLIDIGPCGIMSYAIVSVLGLLIGSIKIGSFSLTTIGGYLLVSLIFGHFGRMGRINLMPPAATLKVFREFGLMLFLIGAGIEGGAKFVEYFQIMYFVYGALITIVPLIIGFLFAKYVLKLDLLNNLGSIAGSMTSTPALGALINVTGTEDVTSAYAATYPIALIAVVVSSQLVVILF